MSKALRASIDLLDYLAMDDASQQRHEYVAGQIYATSGGSERHNRIAFNIARLLADRLEGSPGQVFINDVKLRIEAADVVYYPDVFVRRGTAVAGDAKVATDAALVVEVLSPSTADIDRREKLAAYWKLPGLRAYWLVSQDTRSVEVHERAASGIRQACAYSAGDAVPSEWLGGDAVPIARLYAGTDVA